MSMKYLAKFEIVKFGFLTNTKISGTEIFEAPTIEEAHELANKKAERKSFPRLIVTITDIEPL